MTDSLVSRYQQYFRHPDDDHDVLDSIANTKGAYEKWQASENGPLRAFK